MSLGVHYEILLRNDCLRTDEEQLGLINRHNNNTAPKVLNCSYSENFTLALRMSHRPLSRGTTLVSWVLLWQLILTMVTVVARLFWLPVMVTIGVTIVCRYYHGCYRGCGTTFDVLITFHDFKARRKITRSP